MREVEREENDAYGQKKRRKKSPGKRRREKRLSIFEIYIVRKKYLLDICDLKKIYIKFRFLNFNIHFF